MNSASCSTTVHGERSGLFALPAFSDPAAKQAFEAAAEQRMVLTRRIGLGLCTGIFAALSILDLNLGGESWRALLFFRILAVIVAGAAWIAYCVSTSSGIRERALIAYGIVGLVSEVVMCALADAQAGHFYQFTLAVTMCFGAIIIAPKFSTVAILFGCTVVSYTAAIPFMDGSALSVTINAAFIYIIAGSVLTGSFRRETSNRRQAMAEDELRHVNEALRASNSSAETARDAAIHANEAKSQFLASMSHELRTPMNAIVGFSDAMKNDLFGQIHPPEYREYVQHIHNSGKLMQANIDDLLDNARLDAGKMGWADEHFDLGTVIDGAVAACRSTAEDAELTLEHTGTEFGVTINADPARVGQVVINLINNALKFTEPGGKVSVMQTLTPEGAILISVRDTGCGMSREDLLKVRQPFVQVGKDGYSKAKGGLGLGLAIVSGIVDLMDGRFDLDSELGVGSIASVEIPRGRVFCEEMRVA